MKNYIKYANVGMIIANTIKMTMTADTTLFVFLLLKFIITSALLNLRPAQMCGRLSINSERILYMNLFIIASFIIFTSILSMVIRRHNRAEKNQQEQFWEREQRANQVRRKSLDGLDYVTIPLEDLPIDVMDQDVIVQDCLDTLTSLSREKMVNLAGYTNTDLKLAYGTANITVLSQYDQNFTLLAQTLQKWAETLYNGGYVTEARQILEYAVLTTRSDAGTSYRLLASLYDQDGEQEKVKTLYDTALTLTSPSGKTIARTLRETYRYIAPADSN